MALMRVCFPYFRYLLGRSSNMAIVDVEIPSGYIYTGWRYANDSVRNYQHAINHTGYARQHVL
jgi:hypothetical protein